MPANTATTEQFTVRLNAGDVLLPADVSMPSDATGLVLFAHGSGSGRFSPRNRYVAHILNEGGIGTVLADLLTAREEAVDSQTARLLFDIRLLGERVVAITDWIAGEDRLAGLPLGYFGASTGAAAALRAAAARPSSVGAIVSRGGRPDLAGPALSEVSAPCLFIVGGLDLEVLQLNRQAMAQLPMDTKRRLEIVPGATHLFEEAGTLDTVARLARDWFQGHLHSRSETLN
jgi:putative phosphoribosyl transferase